MPPPWIALQIVYYIDHPDAGLHLIAPSRGLAYSEVVFEQALKLTHPLLQKGIWLWRAGAAPWGKLTAERQSITR